jgi:hypothetical protein
MHEEPVRKPPHPSHVRLVFLLAAAAATIDELEDHLAGHTCRPDSYGNCASCELHDDAVHLRWVLDFSHSMLEGALIGSRSFDEVLVARDQGILASLDGLLEGRLKIVHADAEAAASVAGTADSPPASENPFYTRTG